VANADLASLRQPENCKKNAANQTKSADSPSLLSIDDYIPLLRFFLQRKKNIYSRHTFFA